MPPPQAAPPVRDAEIDRSDSICNSPVVGFHAGRADTNVRIAVPGGKENSESQRDPERMANGFSLYPLVLAGKGHIPKEMR